MQDYYRVYRVSEENVCILQCQISLLYIHNYAYDEHRSGCLTQFHLINELDEMLEKFLTDVCIQLILLTEAIYRQPPTCVLVPYIS